MERIRRRFGITRGPDRIVGYLKTLALHRIIDWVRPEDLLGLQGFKEGQRDKHPRSTPLDYCGVKETELQRLEINYNRTRHGGVDYPQLKRIISKYGDGASVCTGLAYSVREPDIDIWIYDRRTGEPLRKEKYKESLVTMWEPFTIHSDSPETKDSMFIQELKKINREEINKLGFKLGTLDLVKIAPMREWGLKRRRYIDATTLSKDEIVKLQEPLKTDLKSRRLYRMTSTKTWELVGW